MPTKQHLEAYLDAMHTDGTLQELSLIWPTMSSYAVR
jgi:hypothetical protein